MEKTRTNDEASQLRSSLRAPSLLLGRVANQQSSRQAHSRSPSLETDFEGTPLGERGDGDVKAVRFGRSGRVGRDGDLRSGSSDSLSGYEATYERAGAASGVSSRATSVNQLPVGGAVRRSGLTLQDESGVTSGFDGRMERSVNQTSARREPGKPGKPGVSSSPASYMDVMQATVMQEELQLLRDRSATLEKELGRSLSLLAEKDDVVSSLAAENAQCRSALSTLSEEHGRWMDEVESERARYAVLVGELEARLVDREASVEVERKAREELEGGMEEVAAAMDAAEEMLVAMERERNGLAAWVGARLGMAAKEVDAVMRAGGFREEPAAGDNAEDDDTDEEDAYPSHASVLMRANRALEDALVRKAVPVENVEVFVDERMERVAVPVFASREAETVARLRGELAVAREVALQAEAELMMVRGEKTGKEGVEEGSRGDDGKDDGSLAKEADQWREDALEKIIDLEEALNVTNERLESAQAENQQLASLLETAISAKDAQAADQSTASKRSNETFVEMQKELQSLRAELYATQRSLSSKEAKVASLLATQQFSLDISDWDSFADVGIDGVDPSSAPVEFLVRSLQEAASMQAELLESLSEHAYERAEGRSALVQLERDLERVLAVLSAPDNADKRYAVDDFAQDGRPRETFAQRLAGIERDEVETLRSQVEKSVAIQQGQAEAYSLLAKKTREKEAELKAKVKGYEAVLREHEAFFADLDTAVPAVRAGLAKVALAEEGEAAAAAILSRNGDRDCDHKSEILELSILVSDKLASIAHAMADGTLASASGNGRETESRYTAMEAQYRAQLETAKAEARQATAALHELQHELRARSMAAMSPASVSKGGVSRVTGNATSGAIIGDDLLGFVTRFEELLDESGRLEDRIRTLENENARLVAANGGNGGGGVDVESIADELAAAKAEIDALQTANRQQLEHIEALRQELDGTHASLESAIRKQTLQSDRHVEDLSQLKEIYERQISQLKIAAEADRTHLVGMVDRAADETTNLAETLAAAEHNLSRLETRLEDVEAEKQTLERERITFAKGHVRRTDAMNAEAALAQAKAERAKRVELERKLASVVRHHNGLYEEEQDGSGGDDGDDGDDGATLDDETMKARLKDAQGRIDDLERRLVGDGIGGANGSIKAKWGRRDDAALETLENDVVRLFD